MDKNSKEKLSEGPGNCARGERGSLIQSLDRGMIILEAVGRSRNPVRLTELAELLGIDRSNAFRLASTLKRRGFLACPDGRKDYILGPSVWRLSRKYDWSKMLIRVCHENLKSLAAQSGETAHLAVREGRQALFIDHVTSNHPISVSGQTGEMVPLYCSAHGKALLADHKLTQLQARFGTVPLEAHTSHTIVSLDRLAAECAEIKVKGYAVDDQEYVEGIRCVAAPIRTKGAVVASIGISAPLTRFPQRRYHVCGEQVKVVVEEITRILDSQMTEAAKGPNSGAASTQAR
jgi:IclR family transcriptional regulator, acetate operon repressor